MAISQKYNLPKDDQIRRTANNFYPSSQLLESIFLKHFAYFFRTCINHHMRTVRDQIVDFHILDGMV
jgi:hypothetical protein